MATELPLGARPDSAGRRLLRAKPFYDVWRLYEGNRCECPTLATRGLIC